MTGHLKDELLRPLLWLGLVLFVIISAALARPRVRPTTIEFPPPLGVRFISWFQLVLWPLMIGAALEVGMDWLAAFFVLGPLYALWRWPETISIDDLRIHQSAWCHRDVSILWQEVAAIEHSGYGDSLVIRGRNGEKIGVSASQAGAEQLAAEITRRTGLPCPEWHAAV